VLSRFKSSGRPLAFAKALSKKINPPFCGMLTVVSKHDKAAVLCRNRKSSEHVMVNPLPPWSPRPLGSDVSSGSLLTVYLAYLKKNSLLAGQRPSVPLDKKKKGVPQARDGQESTAHALG
jgi:hypothetical protein